MGPSEDASAEGSSSPAARESRISELETFEAKRREGARLDRRFELFEAIVLSIAALLAAWTGFQSAKWSGSQANSYSQAGASRVESTQQSTLAGQETTVDVISFTQWLQAAEAEGLLAKSADTTKEYVPDPNVLSGFLYLRFRPEFEVAAKAWVATHPRQNANAPPTPFVMPEYQVAAAKEATRLNQQAEMQAASARAANQRSDNYVLMTIMFATVLFFAGISSKMDTFRARVFLLGVATTLLVSGDRDRGDVPEERLNVPVLPGGALKRCRRRAGPGRRCGSGGRGCRSPGRDPRVRTGS